LIRKTILLFIIFSLNLNLAAQKNVLNLQDFGDSYMNYFKMDREVLFVQLNKTILLAHEDLWFSVYVKNSNTALPSLETANLIIDILDDNGKILDTQTILVTAGKGSGFIEMGANKYTPGKFYLRAHTNFMKNFEEDLSFLQAFHITGENHEIITKEEQNDLQVLPEGGHLIQNIKNSLGVKLLDHHGNGLNFTNGKLLTSNDELITTFESNQFGLARFSFTPNPTKDYKISVTTANGNIETKKIIKAARTGLNLITTNQDDSFLFSVSTNDTIQVKDNTYYTAIHQAGKIKHFAFQFPQGIQSVDIKWKKDSLYPGVNTFTVFDNTFNPIVERQVFNQVGIKRVNLKSNFQKKEGDSLKLEIIAGQKVKNSSLSISVLPGKSVSYKSIHNFLSAFYLKPYLKGTIENASYYFSKGNQQEIRKDLDLLMLTQGWSKYEWKHIYNNDPEEIYKREVGFELKGTVPNRNRKKEKSLYVIANATGLSEILPIDDNDQFSLNNFYILDSTAISFGTINEKNGAISKPAILANVYPLKNYEKYSNFLPATKSPFLKEYKPVPSNFTEDPTAMALDTVQLIGLNKEAVKFRKELEIIKSDVIITEELEKKYRLITDYIATQGFRVIEGGYGSLIIESKSPKNFIQSKQGLGAYPQIYFNGARLDSDIGPLKTLLTSEVESILVSPSGAGYGMNGFNGVIEITTKKGSGRIVSSKETLSEIITNNGFSRDRAFYLPKYTSYNSESFDKFGAIDWLANVELDPNGKASFKILNTLQEEIILYIEGMTLDGKLISEKLTVGID